MYRLRGSCLTAPHRTRTGTVPAPRPDRALLNLFFHFNDERPQLGELVAAQAPHVAVGVMHEPSGIVVQVDVAEGRDEVALGDQVVDPEPWRLDVRRLHVLT